MSASNIGLKVQISSVAGQRSSAHRMHETNLIQGIGQIIIGNGENIHVVQSKEWRQHHRPEVRGSIPLTSLISCGKLNHSKINLGFRKICLKRLVTGRYHITKTGILLWFVSLPNGVSSGG